MPARSCRAQKQRPSRCRCVEAMTRPSRCVRCVEVEAMTAGIAQPFSSPGSSGSPSQAHLGIHEACIGRLCDVAGWIARIRVDGS